MAETTKIQWCHHTFNPWRGCTKVSPGCANCYAEKQSKRNPKVLGEWGPNGRRAIAAESYWLGPLGWNKVAAAAGERRRVFCLSLGDVFEDLPELVGPRCRLFDLIERTPALDWLLLTKRPENWAKCMHDCLRALSFVSACRGMREGAIRQWIDHWDVIRQWIDRWQEGDYPPNVWLGVSVEDQERAEERIPELCEIPAAVRFLSVEPLLEEIDLTDHLLIPEVDPIEYGQGPILGYDRPIGWVIVGGESGPNARPCQVDWIRSIVGQCRGAGVACFVKQLGANITSDDDTDACNSKAGTKYALGAILLSDPKGGDPEEWPLDLRIRGFPYPPVKA